jgi:RNA polymerase sigma-70 factor (ECF subfamily)
MGQLNPAQDAGVNPGSIELTTEVDQPLQLAEVYRLYADRVVQWAGRLSGAEHDAGDLAHEVFCVVQRRLWLFRPRAATIETWLFRITQNVVRAYRRRQRLRALFFTADPPPETADDRRSAPEDLAGQQDIRLVYSVLDRLTETDRALVVLFELEGYSGAKVAELTGLKPSTVWVRLHRARQRFLAELASLDPKQEIAP